MTEERYGYTYVRPEFLIPWVEPPPPTLAQRVRWTISDAVWSVLTFIAPSLPIVGALVGMAIARAIFGP